MTVMAKSKKTRLSRPSQPKRLLRRSRLARLGASPEQIERDLKAFSAAARVLSSDHPRLIDEHPKRWVGVYQGKVAASAESMDALLAELEDAGIPAGQTIVRFIDKEERTLIL